MHPKVQQKFHSIIATTGVRPRRALEVGGVMGPNSLLHWPQHEGAERYSINLVPMKSVDGITSVTGSGNDMSMFDDGMFDLVMSNATLEHDKHFWLSLREMHRVLAPGGLLIIGTPGYTKDPERDHGKSTHTYRVHYRFDYYRFSEQTFREVFFAGMRNVTVQPILQPPRIIGHGFKPEAGIKAVRQQAAVPARRARRVLRRLRAA
jgi:SAM-dependent methyltransferase